jgi:dolichol-phosphate mannosyltransferase
MSATPAAAAAPTPVHGPATLAVVVPTYNESANVRPLLDAIERALPGIAWEVVFVDDDSPDGTADELRLIARHDARVRVVQRIGRRGLASACIEGALATAAPYVAVIDGDLQHDERLLAPMLALLDGDRADLVIGTRYGAGGGVGEWQGSRMKGSRAATWLANRLLPTGVSDPMSGFFMLRRDLFMTRVRDLTGQGFKILLDLLTAGGEPARVAELPYRFRARQAGDSKLDASVAWDLGLLMLERLLGRRIPARFLAFSIVGGLGVLVHFALLSVLLAGTGTRFAAAQAIAATGAMVGNFALNNELTFRDRRLRGWAWWRGLGSFLLVCSVGAASNVGVAVWLFDRDAAWAVAGLAGIAVGAVWNYALSAVYTWGGTGSRRQRLVRPKAAVRDTFAEPAGEGPAVRPPRRFT